MKIVNTVPIFFIMSKFSEYWYNYGAVNLFSVFKFYELFG